MLKCFLTSAMFFLSPSYLHQTTEVLMGTSFYWQRVPGLPSNQ